MAVYRHFEYGQGSLSAVSFCNKISEEHLFYLHFLKKALFAFQKEKNNKFKQRKWQRKLRLMVYPYSVLTGK